MEGIQTPQEAKEIDLSVNPLKRHRQVESYLANMAVGADVEILINPNAIIIEDSDPRTLALYTVSPILGRRALVRVARGIEFLDANGYGKGMEN